MAAKGRSLAAAGQRQGGIHRVPAPVVHLGPVREQIGDEAGAGSGPLGGAGPSRVGGGSADMMRTGTANGEIGNIVEVLIRVVDHSQ